MLKFVQKSRHSSWMSEKLPFQTYMNVDLRPSLTRTAQESVNARQRHEWRFGFCCWRSIHAYCLFHAMICNWVGIACAAYFNLCSFFFFLSLFLFHGIENGPNQAENVSFCEKCVQYFDNQIVIIRNVIVLQPNMLFIQEIRHSKFVARQVYSNSNDYSNVNVSIRLWKRNNLNNTRTNANQRI